MYFDTSSKTSRRDFSGISCPGHLSHTVYLFFVNKDCRSETREKRRWKVVMEHVRALQKDTTMSVQRYGRGDVYYSGDISFVTKLSRMDVHEDKTDGFS